MAEEQKTGCSPSDCAGCSHAGECGSKPQSLIKPENKKSHINHVIAVVSGKGGVGKSMVTASLARLMREQGFSVGIMDADITGTKPRESVRTRQRDARPRRAVHQEVPCHRQGTGVCQQGIRRCWQETEPQWAEHHTDLCQAAEARSTPELTQSHPVNSEC